LAPETANLLLLLLGLPAQEPVLSNDNEPPANEPFVIVTVIGEISAPELTGVVRFELTLMLPIVGAVGGLIVTVKFAVAVAASATEGERARNKHQRTKSGRPIIPLYTLGPNHSLSPHPCHYHFPTHTSG
jgi:hypothetical protein